MHTRAALAVTAGALLAACQSSPDYQRLLDPGAPALIPVEDPAQLPDFRQEWYSRSEILPALERSLHWTRREHARQFFPIAGISHDLALRSLERFQELLQEASSPEELDAALKEEFTVYASAGWDGQGGGVLFTGYCTPLFDGSLERDDAHPYPLYALPDNLVKGAQGEILGWQSRFGLFKYPMRASIEEGGLLANKGLELVWLTSPMDAYIAHVNGSAFVHLESGEMLRLGYHGKNGRDYSSLGRELIEAGEITSDQMSLAAIRAWASRADPNVVQEHLRRNDSFVFFQPIEGNPHGSLDEEVEGLRSVATDKTLFPRGALMFLEVDIPLPSGGRRQLEQFAFDQDTGGAIRSAGRADIYFGVGPEAEAVAGGIRSPGQMYYLFLSE